MKHAVLASLTVVAVAIAAAPSAVAAEPADVVRAALLTTDAAIESGRFRGTMSERGYLENRRVIATSTVENDLYEQSPSDLRGSITLRSDFMDVDIQFAAVRNRFYMRNGSKSYFVPVKKRAYRASFRHKRSKPLPTLVDLSIALLSEWRDDGPSVSDGVPVQNYSGAVDFYPLASRLLPWITEAVYDGFYALNFSDPLGWRDATLTSVVRPRVTFSVDASNVLRKVHVEAPQTLTVQGYELLGDFEFFDVNEFVPIRPPKGAKRLTKKRAKQLGIASALAR